MEQGLEYELGEDPTKIYRKTVNRSDEFLYVRKFPLTIEFFTNSK